MDQKVSVRFEKIEVIFTNNSVTIIPTNSKNPLLIPITIDGLKKCIKEKQYEEIPLDSKTTDDLRELLNSSQTNMVFNNTVTENKITQGYSLHFQFITKPNYIQIEECLNLSLREYAFFIKNLFDNLENNKSTRLIKYSIEHSLLYIPEKKIIPVNVDTLKAALKFYLKFEKEINPNLPPTLLEEIHDIIYDVMD